MKKYFIFVACAAVAALAYAEGAHPSQTGRYAIAIAPSNGTAWRIDTTTGEASYCIAGTAVNPASGCSQWMK